MAEEKHKIAELVQPWTMEKRALAGDWILRGDWSSPLGVCYGDQFASLVSAAPELLEAAMAFVEAENMDDNGVGKWSERVERFDKAYDLCVKAIYSATGKSVEELRAE